MRCALPYSLSRHDIRKHVRLQFFDRGKISTWADTSMFFVYVAVLCLCWLNSFAWRVCLRIYTNLVVDAKIIAVWESWLLTLCRRHTNDLLGFHISSDSVCMLYDCWLMLVSSFCGSLRELQEVPRRL